MIADGRVVSLKSGVCDIAAPGCDQCPLPVVSMRQNQIRDCCIAVYLPFHDRCSTGAASKQPAERSTLDFGGTADVAHVAAFSALAARSINLKVRCSCSTCLPPCMQQAHYDCAICCSRQHVDDQQ